MYPPQDGFKLRVHPRRLSFHERPTTVSLPDEARKLLDNLSEVGMDASRSINSDLVESFSPLNLEFSKKTSFDTPVGYSHAYGSSETLDFAYGDTQRRFSFTELDFIRSVGEDFSLPYEHGELDWLMNIDPDLYVDPISALLQSTVKRRLVDDLFLEEEMRGDTTPADPLDYQSLMYEFPKSFLDMDSDSEEDEATESEATETDEDTDTEHEVEIEDEEYHPPEPFAADSMDRSSAYSCGIAHCTLRHEKRIIRVVLPQVHQHDTWKRPGQQTYTSPPKKKSRFRASIAFKCARAIFCGMK